MVHVRETRAFASEIKFLIQPAIAPRLVEWARRHLEADPHGQGPFGDEYDTTTLYFDTPRLDVFHRRGSFGRAKYRVRRYGPSEQVFLERKLRKPGGVLSKRRTMLPLAALADLAGGQSGGPPDAEWFRRRLLLRSLAPVCQVSYHRTARQVETSDGPARLTLDSRLRAVAIDTTAFTAAPGVPFGGERLILELKYRRQLPAIFRRLVEELALRTETASKYRLGMTALGYVPAEGDQQAIGSRTRRMPEFLARAIES
jgi:hypothetical protein